MRTRTGQPPSSCRSLTTSLRRSEYVGRVFVYFSVQFSKGVGVSVLDVCLFSFDVFV